MNRCKEVDCPARCCRNVIIENVPLAFVTGENGNTSDLITSPDKLEAVENQILVQSITNNQEPREINFIPISLKNGKMGIKVFVSGLCRDNTGSPNFECKYIHDDNIDPTRPAACGNFLFGGEECSSLRFNSSSSTT